jgi:hypothetical protein
VLQPHILLNNSCSSRGREAEPFGSHQLPNGSPNADGHWRDTNTASFTYTALDNNSHEIRILEFAAAEPLMGESIASVAPFLLGRLKHASLIDTQPYTALSYCWGDPASHKFLQLYSGGAHAQNVAITDNLHSALYTLWKRRGEKEVIRVWVDALCINQHDLYEQSQQVQMMGQIYSRAESVLAWVGPIAGSILASTTMYSLAKMQTAIH